MTELKPCPHCGREVIPHYSSGAMFVQCDNNCSMGFVATNIGEQKPCLEQWNKRISDREISKKNTEIIELNHLIGSYNIRLEKAKVALEEAGIEECPHCNEYHPDAELCDGFIEYLEKECNKLEKEEME